MSVNPAAAEGFSAGADAYERGRPSYPPAAMEHLVAVLGLGARRRVVDLGAGTGKFTELLVATGADVVAVEPVAEMRTKLEAALPHVTAVEGTGEAIPAEAGSVDVVTA